MNRSMKSFHKLLSTFEVFESRNGVDVQVIVTKDNFLYIWQPLVCNYNETKKVSKICDLFFTCAMMCCFFTTEVTENCLSKTIETLSDFFSVGFSSKKWGADQISRSPRFDCNTHQYTSLQCSLFSHWVSNILSPGSVILQQSSCLYEWTF